MYLHWTILPGAIIRSVAIAVTHRSSNAVVAGRLAWPPYLELAIGNLVVKLWLTAVDRLPDPDAAGARVIAVQNKCSPTLRDWHAS